MMKMMKQAAAMQESLKTVQAELAQRQVEFSSGGGMVTVTATGDGNVVAIRIDPKLVDPSDVDMLQDTVLAAVNGAIQTAKDMAAKEMSKLTAGLGIPGL
jgi:DNA-binding YbaB/EbfC family protein